METPSASWNPAELTAHTEWVRGLALRLVRDSARADDLVQETFLAALERRPGQERSLRPWLRRVLHRRFALGQRREARRAAREEAGASPESLPSSDELVENAEAHALLVRELTKLREPYRTALLLRYFEGKSPAEIAASQGVPATTVRSQLKRGLDELRERLDRRNGGDRRAWSLALIPFAATSRDATPPGGALSSLTQTIRAMNPLTQVIVGSTVALTAVAFVAQQVDLLPPGAADPGVFTSAGGGTAATPAIDAGAASSTGNRRNAAESSSMVMAPGSEDEKITGVVLDAESGLPLSGFALEIQLYTRNDQGERVPADEDAEEVRTDEAGSFATERVYAAGAELGIREIDHVGMCRASRSKRTTMTHSSSGGGSHTWKPEEAPIQLPVRGGPTYPLALTAPFDWRSTELIGWLKPSENEPWSVLESCSLFRSPVRGETSPWLRFGPLSSFLPTDRPWLLRVETADGLYGGEAQVEAGDGIYPETVAITIAPAAKLMVNLISDTGVGTSTVVVQAVNGSTRRVLLGGAQEVGDDGRYRCCRVLYAIPPGEYDLLVSCEGIEPVQETVTLFAGEMLSHDVEVALSPERSFVHGELRSVSGQFQERIQLFFRNRTTGQEVILWPKWEEREGEWVAPFAVDSLVPEEHDLLLFAEYSFHRWMPLPARIDPPLEELILTCQDTEPARKVMIHTTDAATGAEIESSHSHLSLEGCSGCFYSMGGGGRMFFEGVPVEPPMEWWSAAPGYLPRWGDESAINGQEFDHDLIEVSLEPGWGVRIDACQLAGNAALEGLEVIVDGGVVGVTDATGRFELILEEEPDTIELRRDGWRFVRGRYDPESKKMSGLDPNHPVLFEPDA